MYHSNNIFLPIMAKPKASQIIIDENVLLQSYCLT